MTPDILDKYRPFAGYGASVTGGAGGPVHDVRSGDEWNALIKAHDKTPDAPVIYNIVADITGANTSAKEITIKERKNITVTSPGNGVQITGIGVHCSAVENFLAFNVKGGLVGEGQKDLFGFEKASKRLWLLHCEGYGDMKGGKDDYDGLADFKAGTEYYAVTACHWHDHHKVCLNGSSDSDLKGGRYFTYALNLHRNVGSRLPSVRGGHVHVAYNVYDGVTESAINLRMGCEALVEGNTFSNVDNPIVGIDSKSPGAWNLRANLYGSGVAWPHKLEKGKEATAQDGKSTTDWEPEYSPSFPTLDPILTAEWVEANAGLVPPGKTLTMPGGGSAPPTEEEPTPEPDQPAEEPEEQVPPQEEPEVVDLGPIAIALDEAEAALGRLRRLLGAG
jgi:pectate lyase